MSETSRDLPDECWAMIFEKLDHGTDCESVSLVCKRFLSLASSVRASLEVFCPSIQVLTRQLQRFSHLKKIKLVKFRGDLNKAISTISKSGLNLEELDLSYNADLSTSCLEELGSNMKNLKTIDCSHSCLTDADLVRIANFFPELEALHLCYSCFPHIVNGKIIAVTDEGIQYLSSKLKRLRTIDLSGNKYISDKSLFFLSLNCTILEKIVVGYCSGVTENGLLVAIQNSSCLNSLVLCAHFKFRSFGVKGSANIPKNLQSLSFSSVDISDEFLCSIAEAGIPLKVFKLMFCNNYTFFGISSLLHSYQSLTSLVLLGAEFLTNEHIEHISKYLHNLTSIDLNSCPKLSDSAFVILTERCTLLSDFQFEGTNLGREEFNYDRSMKNYAIKYLGLSSNQNLSSLGVRRLLKICPSTEKLELRDCFKRGKQLDVADIFEGNSGIKSLMLNGCQNLKLSRENVEIPELQKMEASYSGIDDETLTMIGKTCRRMVHLDLEDCDKVTDEGVKEVVGSCERLRYLNLNDCYNVGSCERLRYLDLNDRYDVGSSERLGYLELNDCYNVKSDIIDTIVSRRPSLRRLVLPAHLYPEKEQQECFLQGGCLIIRGYNYEEHM